MDQQNPQQQNYQQPKPSPASLPVSAPPSPQVNSVSGGVGDEHKSSVGPIVGSVIVVLVIVLGGLYLYGSQMNKSSDQSADQNASSNIANAPDPDTAALQNQGSTDSLDSIDADIKATNTDNLDSDTTNVSSSLQSAQ